MAQARKKPEEREETPLQATESDEERVAESEEQTKLPTSGYAKVGLALSIVSPLLPAVLAMSISALGAILGGIALTEIQRGYRTGVGMAWAAVAIGGVVFMVTVFFISGLLNAS